MQALEFKVGLFLLIALVAIFIALHFMGYVKARSATYELTLLFDNAGGITEGQAVYMSGVKVGQVVNVSIDPTTYKAVVKIAVNSDVKIPTRSIFYIGGSLMGERYIYIKPIASKTYFKPGSRVVSNTISPVEWAEIMLSGKQAFDNLNAAANDIRRVLADLNVGRDVRATLKKLDKLISKAQTLIATLETQVNQLTGVLVTETRRTSDNANSLLITARRKISTTTDKINRVSDELYAMISENRPVIREMVSNLNNASSEASGILRENRRDIRETVIHIKNTVKELESDVKAVSPLLKDKKLHENIKQTMERGEQVVETAEFLLLPVKDLKERTLKKGEFRFAIPSVQIVNIEDYYHNPVTTLDIDIFPYSKQFFRLGVFDLGYENLLDLQVGYWSDDMKRRLRVGLIESDLGLGFEQQLGDNFWFSADLYKPSDMTLNTYILYGNPSKVSFKVGYRNVLERTRRFTIGIFKQF